MAKQNSLSLATLQKKFSTEKKCREHLFKLRFPDGFVCPRCGHKEYFLITTRNLYECKSCGYQASITAGTIFHKTRTSLVKWFWAVYFVSKDKGGISALALKKHLNISYQTAWLMLHKIRKAMEARDENYYLWLIFEKDDVIKNKEGNQMVIQVALRSADRKPRFIKMRRIRSEDRVVVIESIKKELKEKEEKLCKVGYDISMEEEKFIEKWIGLIIKNLKAYLNGTYHNGCRKHLQKYIDEYTYRFNRRLWERELFNRLLFACLNAKTITYTELTG
jgi:transposase-like protein